ncbi:MAG: putative Ig domain-containing protein [Methylovulum sp.]|nr:putative Ig domain-containing protein [Methylovulum sp.]
MKRFLPSLLWLAVAGSATAAPVTLQFTGTDAYGPLNVVSPLGSGTVPKDAPYTATVTFDDAQVVTPVAYYGGTRSTYILTNLTVTMNGSTITQTGPGTIDIFDNVNPPNSWPPGDTIAFNSASIPSMPITEPTGTLYGAHFRFINIMLVDYTGTAFSGTALPHAINAASYSYGQKSLELTYTSLSGTTTMILPMLTASSSATIPPTLTTANFANGVIGVPYSSTVTATAPNNDTVTISIDPTTLPMGLSFDGVNISGTPVTVETRSVAITVNDTVSGLSASTNLALTINDAAINFTPSITDAVTGSAYSVTLSAATGGTGSFSYTSSGLPAGLSLTGTTIAGTAPATAGVYAFTVTATDSAGTATVANLSLNVVAPAPVACSGSNAVESAYVARNPGFITVNGGLNLLDHLWTTNLNPQNTTFQGGLVNWYQTGLILSYTGVTDPAGCILSSLTVSPAVSVSTANLASATVNSSYLAPISAAWGATPYQSISVSGQPVGLSFDGVNLTGIPTVVGTFPVTVTVIDAVGATAVKTLSLVVNDQAISFAPVLPAAIVGTAYSTSVTATGYGPFSYTASGLPLGLSLAGNAISGTPTTAGSSVLTLTATDAAGAVSSAVATLVVNPAAVTPSCTAPAVLTNGICVTPVATDPSCTKPAGAKSFAVHAAITATGAGNITIGTKVVTIPSCAKVQYKGQATTFGIGYDAEVKSGYTLNGINYGTSLIVDDGK